MSTLYKQYRKEIQEWNWEYLSAAAETGEEGEQSVYLGSVFSIMPSGKYWAFLANGNVDNREMHRDEEFMRAREDIASKYGASVESGEGDPCDMFITWPAES